MQELIKYIFYITSLTYKPSSEVIILQRDSLTYFNGIDYVTKPIIHRKHNLIVVQNAWFHFSDKSIEMYQFGSKVRRKYRIREIADNEQHRVKSKPIWLN